MTKNIELTHTAIKNDAKAVTGYAIKANGVLVGNASKSDKGKFSFTGLAGAVADLAVAAAIVDVATMRDLKVAVGKIVVPAFVEANQPKPEPKKEKAPAAAKTDAPAAAATGDAEGDIDLT